MNDAMNETTKRELQLLTEKIKKNPKLLKPNLKNDSSDEESSESSDSEYIESSDSESSYDSEKKSITIYKKEQLNNKLREKNYYKTLEISNLMLENNKIKEELDTIKKVLLEKEIILQIINDFLEFKNNESNKKIINKDSLTIENINSTIFLVEKNYNDSVTSLENIKKKLNNQSNSIIKNNYTEEIIKMNINIINTHDKNMKIINNFIKECKFNEILGILKIIFIIILLYILVINFY